MGDHFRIRHEDVKDIQADIILQKVYYQLRNDSEGTWHWIEFETEDNARSFYEEWIAAIQLRLQNPKSAAAANSGSNPKNWPQRRELFPWRRQWMTDEEISPASPLLVCPAKRNFPGKQLHPGVLCLFYGHENTLLEF